MKQKATITLILVLITSVLLAQNRFLTGIVKMAGLPVKGLTVYTSFATATTDDLGRYALDLQGCPNCRLGEKITLFTFHKDIASSEQICTISSDYKYNLNIIRVSNYYVINGIVKTSGSEGEPLANIDVKVMGTDYDVESVRTNNFGEFKISIRKDLIPPGQNAVLLQPSDRQKVYKSIRIQPDLYNINSFIILEMIVARTELLRVAGYMTSKTCVKAGDAVSIEASGQIRIGTLAGSSDPDGRTSGVLNMALESYNLVPNFNHAVLMYRFTGETEWKVAGKKKKFIVPSGINGCIEFQINDNTQSDNYGHYDVEVSVQSN